MKKKLTFHSMFEHRASRKVVCIAIALLSMALIVNPTQGQQSRAHASVRFDALNRVFRIDAADTTYVFGVNETGQLQNLYWGSRISEKDHFAQARAMDETSSFDPPSTTTPQEFTGWGGALYVEPDLKITFPDGNRDLVLRYVSNEIHGESLSVVMKDISRGVYVTLVYQMDGETGILRRSAEVENRTEFPLTIEQVAAGTWNLPEGTNYRLHYLSGRWAGEWNLNTQNIGPGKTVLESRRGTTGAQNNPWFAIDRGTSSDEDSGEVWFGALG
jgi:alpha-galactosidase